MTTLRKRLFTMMQDLQTALEGGTKMSLENENLEMNVTETPEQMEPIAEDATPEFTENTSVDNSVEDLLQKIKKR